MARVRSQPSKTAKGGARRPRSPRKPKPGLHGPPAPYDKSESKSPPCPCKLRRDKSGAPSGGDAWEVDCEERAGPPPFRTPRRVYLYD